MKKKFPIIVAYFIAGVFFASVISYSAVREAYRNRKIEANIEELNRERELIQKENDTLSKTIDYLGSQENIERTAKQKLNMKRPDENVIVVKPSVQQEKPENIQEENEERTTPDIPNYKKWLNFFFKYN
jgi:cell division protein FtsL